MPEAKERPILFSGPMVRAILAWSKTQTRRVVQPQPTIEEIEVIGGFSFDWKGCETPKEMLGHSPYGCIGDRLWVRESFSPDWCDHPIYKADGGSAKEAGYSKEPRWKPSIHMPRRASRITLEITGVRVERLKEISEEDAKAEGVWGKDDPYQGVGDLPTDRFVRLWDAINAKRGYSWESNPWVWVIEFRNISGVGLRASQQPHAVDLASAPLRPNH